MYVMYLQYHLLHTQNYWAQNMSCNTNITSVSTQHRAVFLPCSWINTTKATFFMSDSSQSSPHNTTSCIKRWPNFIGRIRTVVSISHCGCDDPGSIPGFDMLGFQPFFLMQRGAKLLEWLILAYSRPVMRRMQHVWRTFCVMCDFLWMIFDEKHLNDTPQYL